MNEEKGEWVEETETDGVIVFHMQTLSSVFTEETLFLLLHLLPDVKHGMNCSVSQPPLIVLGNCLLRSWLIVRTKRFLFSSSVAFCPHPVSPH